MVSFRIMHKPDSWNSLVRKHYRTVMRVFATWHSLTWEALQEYKIPKITGPVRLVAIGRWKGDGRHDVDNILLKPVIDMMVKAEIFEDDDLTNITEIISRGYKNQDVDALEIYILPVESGTDEHLSA